MSRFFCMGIFLLACLIVLPIPGSGQSLNGGAVPLHFLTGETVPIIIEEGWVTIDANATPSESSSPDTKIDKPMGKVVTEFQSLPSGTMSIPETQDLNFLQELEQMQVDLFGVLANQYSNAPLFASLRDTEQEFLNADEVVLRKYGMTNPVAKGPGIYTDPLIQNLYNRLNSKGGLLTDSYAVAAESEEIHIADLAAALGRSRNPDLQYLYTQDLAISKNNLRAIAAAISSAGSSYAPRYITSEAYNAIIGSPMEKIPVHMTAVPVTPVPTQASVVPTATPVPMPTPVPTMVIPVVTPSPSIVRTTISLPAGPAPMPYALPVQPRAYRIVAAFQAIPGSSLTDAETTDIMYLQEAQKMERDLYLYLGRQSLQDPLFANLALSADALMKADDAILARYELSNPEQKAAGEFSNTGLQRLYNFYAGQSGGTVPGALLAAMQSEDQHIATLYAAIGHTDNPDLQFIYNQQLVFASNNLRAMNMQLGGYGQSYTPQYLSQEAYAIIVNSPMQSVQLTQ